MLTFEFQPSRQSDPCPCCGGRTTLLTRYVFEDGNAHAIYFARFSDNHPEGAVLALVSLGDWGNDGPSERRVSFVLRLWVDQNRPQVSVLNADQSAWHDPDLLGRTLDREEALRHPWIRDVFRITDHMVVDDAPLHDYLSRLAFPP